MQRSKTRFITYTALFTALVAAATAVLHIPMPKSGGYVNLGDSMIFLAGFFLGGIPAMIAGGVGAALADLMLGYAFYAPFTLVIKCLEGLLCGIVMQWIKKRAFKKPLKAVFYFLATLAGGAVMLLGYFLTAFLFYSLPAAVAETLMNLAQYGVSAAVAMAVMLTATFSNRKIALPPEELPPPE